MRAIRGAGSRLLMVAIALSALGAGCSSGEGGPGDSGGAGGSENFQPCSVNDVTGTIPGVKISIQSSRCVYHEGQSAEFSYTVTTDDSVPTIEIMASMGCGACNSPSKDPLSFVSFGISGTSNTGASQNYCVCDVGCCPPDQAAMIKPNAAVSSGTIQWSGRNWQGPSDTGEKEGNFFPPGKYSVDVSFNGRAQGSVNAELSIEIIP